MKYVLLDPCCRIGDALRQGPKLPELHLRADRHWQLADAGVAAKRVEDETNCSACLLAAKTARTWEPTGHKLHSLIGFNQCAHCEP